VQPCTGNITFQLKVPTFSSIARRHGCSGPIDVTTSPSTKDVSVVHWGREQISMVCMMVIHQTTGKSQDARSWQTVTNARTAPTLVLITQITAARHKLRCLFAVPTRTFPIAFTDTSIVAPLVMSQPSTANRACRIFWCITQRLQQSALDRCGPRFIPICIR